MATNSGPITKNGIHPISKNRVVDVGTSGASRASTPKPAQVAAAGATNGSPGAKKPAAASTPSLAANQGATTKTVGSTTEEQKPLAARLYPKKLGLRGGVA